MREMKNSRRRIEKGTFSAVLLALTLFTGSCTKNEIREDQLPASDLITPTDATAPTIISVLPAVNATSAEISTMPSVTFSEAMNASTVTNASFTLKQGTSVVAGTTTYSDNKATFAPSTSLQASKVYTATITTALKDIAGNALGTTYSWSFTTSALADATAPAVLSVSPALNATTVAVNIKPTATFSEAMNSGSITFTSFNLKQGTTVVPGTVTYIGTTATFTPATDLSSGKVYTGTITTAVKDVAGNAMAATYTWSFTTSTAAPTGKSFSTDVVPVINLCNTCHTHKWTPSSNSSTFYTNLVNAGYVVPAAPTTSKLYSKINNGHPSSTVSSTQKNTILTWMTEGSKNN